MRLVAALAALVTLALVPAAASARWYMRQDWAAWKTREIVRARYDSPPLAPDVYAACRPQLGHHNELGWHGRGWHRWVCSWNAVTYPDRQTIATGEVLLIGSLRRAYNWRLVSGLRWAG
jgi:hypothetical protein